MERPQAGRMAGCGGYRVAGDVQLGTEAGARPRRVLQATASHLDVILSCQCKTGSDVILFMNQKKRHALP